MSRTTSQRRLVSTAVGGMDHVLKTTPSAARLAALTGALLLGFGLAAGPASASAPSTAVQAGSVCDVTTSVNPEPDELPAVLLTIVNNDDESISADGTILRPTPGGAMSIAFIEPSPSPWNWYSMVIAGEARARVHVRLELVGDQGCHRTVNLVGVLPDAPHTA